MIILYSGPKLKGKPVSASFPYINYSCLEFSRSFIYNVVSVQSYYILCDLTIYENEGEL